MLVLAYQVNRNSASGFVEMGDCYRAFHLQSNGRLSLEQEYPKKDFKDLEHFQGVMGKFDPYMPFLDEPIMVDPLTFDNLVKVHYLRNIKKGW